MKPNENWKNSKGKYVGVFVLFFFLCEYIFFMFCVFLFLFLEQVQILRPSVSYLHNSALEFIPVFYEPVRTRMCFI